MAVTTNDAATRRSPTGVDTGAPVVGASEIEIAASPEAVWEMLMAFERRPS
jgi:hypothetical protein